MIQLAALVLVGGLVVCLSVVAARGPGGHRAVLRLLAGYGLLVLVLAGLLVVGLGVPRWQEAMASRQPPGPTAYAVLAGAVGLYLALLTQLARVALARPAPGPGTPATAAATGCGVLALVPAVAAGLVGYARWHRLEYAGRVPPPTEFLLVGGVVALAVAALAGLGRWAVAPPRPAPAPSAARLTPRERRLIAGAAPAGLLVASLAGLFWYGLSHPDGDPRGSWQFPAEVLWLCVIPVVAVGFLHYRLSRWAYPEWWAMRNKLLYPDAADPNPVVAAVADVPAPARPCPRCGQMIAAGSPAGLCPRCLLQGVMPSAAAPHATVGFVEAYVAPPVEDVRKLFPHLSVERLIGQGGMGAVYLARQPALDRPVALKLVRPRPDDPTFAERFVREAKALARMGHPNIVTVYESGEAGGLPYLVMEYVPGPTLRDLMRDKALPPPAALAIIPQICDALEYAHRQGVVHRDIKPENILLNSECGMRNRRPKTEPPVLNPKSEIRIPQFG